jgi:uncharacterized membrane protein required for colicin V production
MGLDLLALGVLAVFVLLGAWRGALATALGIAGLVFGYAAAIFVGPIWGPALANALGAPPFLAIPIGGAAAFAAVVALLAVASRVAAAAEKARRGAAPRGAGDRALGAAFGALRGGFVVLLLGWMGLWLEALQGFQAGAHASDAAGGAAAPGSRVSALAQDAVERGASAFLGTDEAEGRVAARVLARPAETFAGLQGLLESPRIATLRDDTAFWDALEAGDVNAALARGSFRSLAYDAGLRRDLAALGLVDAASAGDPKRAEQELRDVLLRVAPRLEGLRSDPELLALLQDAQVRAALERGEHWSLLQHPGFQRLVTRIASGSPSGGA